ncbi:MAG TPA: VanZ family protein [Burkholderiales bacterium]|nr:VanZ family protein [Burkholderiales bacterium]
MNRPTAEGMTLRSAPGTADTGARLGMALLGYMLAVTIFVTLVPFRFEWPSEWRVLVSGGRADIVANVLLFIPLGFLYCLSAPVSRPRSILHVVAAGLIASAMIETLQLFEPQRRAALSDVVANAAGAWLGAVVFDRLARSLRPRDHLLGWLALELPLMGLIYLLIPLLWVSSISSNDDPWRAAVTLSIGLFGAILLGGMQRHYFGPARASDAAETGVFAAIWLLAGTFPLLAWHPIHVIGAAVFTGMLCWWLGRRRVSGSGNRRFEVPLLKVAARAYAVYLVMAILVPLRAGTEPWTLFLWFQSHADHRNEILRLLELVAAFTLVGYMNVEFRGRDVMLYKEALPRLLGWGLGLAFAAQVARGFQPGYGASVAAGGILVAATLYGGWLYHLQRAHVMRLLSASGADDHSLVTKR